MVNTNRIRFALAAVLALPLAACYDANRIADTGDMRHDPFEMHKDVQIEEVLEHPEVFKNQPIRFELMYNDYGDDDIWLPFYTPFTPDHFVPFSGWSPRAAVWMPDVYQRPMRTLFIERRSHEFDVHNWPAREKFAVIEIEGTVLSVFDGIPWIHVTDISAVDEAQFTSESLGGLIRALELTAAGSPAAASELERVLNTPLSEAARLHIHMTLGSLYMNENDGHMAAQHYEMAWQLSESELQRESIRVSLQAARAQGERQSAAGELRESTDHNETEDTPAPEETPKPSNP